MRFRVAAFGTVTLSLLLAGCATSPQAPALPGAAAVANRPATAGNTYLYVTDPTVNRVEVLDPTYKLVETITSGLNFPVGDWVDSKGNLYVANEGKCDGSGNVVEYAHGSTTPTYTYSSGLICPLFVGADSSGNVFVFDYGTGGPWNFLAEYPQGQNTVTNTWNTCNTGTYAFCYPTGLTMVSSGELMLAMYGAVHGSLGSYWVADEVLYNQKYNNQFYLTGYTGAGGGVAIDKKFNVLVGANPVPKGGVGGAKRRSGPGGWAIVRTPHKHGTEIQLHNLKYIGFTFVDSLTLSADQKTLFVADYGGKDVTVLTYPKGAFVKALGSANGLTDPGSAALGPAP